MFPHFNFSEHVKFYLTGCPQGSDALALSEYFKTAHRSVLYVVADDFILSQTESALRFFAPDIPLVVFPAWDCLPYDRTSPSADVMAARMRGLAQCLSAENPLFVLTTFAAMAQKLIHPDDLRSRQIALDAGKQIDIGRLTGFLSENGYSRVGTVREVGEYAIRGNLIDLFPPHYESPLRIDLFGDTIEAMRFFDAVSQRKLSGAPINHLLLYPAQEVLLHDASIANFRAFYRETFGASAMHDPIYESISAGRRYAGMEHWLPFFYARTATIMDYVADAVLVAGYGLPLAIQSRDEEIKEYYIARRQFLDGKLAKDQPVYRPIPPESLYLNHQVWSGLWNANHGIKIEYSHAAQDQIAAVDFGAEPIAKLIQTKSYVQLGQTQKLFEEFKVFLASAFRREKVIGIACYSAGSMDRIQKLLSDFEIEAAIVPAWANFGKTKRNRVELFVLPIEHGFARQDTIIISEQDLLGDRLSRTSKRERKAEDVLSEASALGANDYVVHIDHGVGRFAGLVTIQAGGADHDCLQLEYAGGDKLFVPVENIELLSRFGSQDALVTLDKLGGAAWQSRKARVKQRIAEMAEQLIRIAAARQLRMGEVLSPPANYEQFCSRFAYAETDDQLRAIADTMRDLSSGKPMDRLVCGDVGFGKTEVALRAAFVAASHGAQVAVVVPTTLLARQHFHNFSRRFDGFGIKIAQLSRMVTHADAALIRQDLSDGKINIIIGTHALLAKSVKFDNLRLLIVDEEQHFGVAQKERLKDLQDNVHILTLTATPIPRTLQMALTGVRDLSIIATPPVDRHAVQTHVMPYDAMIVREAVLRERHRGGQCFYVCPRIDDLDEVAANMRELIPDIRLGVANGQMPPSALEDVMQDFVEQKFDVLVSTNIIESGLDIPSANTIVIHRADMFGLAQLYQLRGRVGRGKTRAYAYLTIPERAVPTEVAQKRLQVMQTLDHLGAGFTIASHDMDIRGAGNLLGEEQSGHVREVGIELYQHLLQEAVADARSGKSSANSNPVLAVPFSPQINLGIPVLIPESYIADLPTRMSFYRRISALRDEASIQSLAAEMVDRFGALPEEVENLLTVVGVKSICHRVGIEKIDAGPKGAVVAFYKNKFANPEALIKYIQSQSGTIKIRPDQKLVLMRAFGDSNAKINGVRAFMGEIEKLVA